MSCSRDILARLTALLLLGLTGLLLGLTGCSAATPADVSPEASPKSSVQVSAPSGAVVALDGVVVGWAPLDASVSVSPGPHQLRVTQTGHHAFERTLSVPAGRTVEVVVDLDETSQRKAAWGLMGGGAGLVATAVGLGVASVVYHRETRDLAQEAGNEQACCAAGSAFDDALGARDALRIGSGVSAGVGLASFVAGAMLFAFDEPAGGETGMALRPSVNQEQAMWLLEGSF